MVKIRKIPQTGLHVEAQMETPSRVLVRAGQRSLRLDMPELLGGSNKGMMPLEALFGAYAGSLNVVSNFVAKTMDFDLRRAEFEVSAMLDPRGIYGLAQVRKAVPSLRLKVRVTTNESARRLAQLRKLVGERCPVHNLLKGAGVRIQETWERVEPRVKSRVKPKPSPQKSKRK